MVNVPQIIAEAKFTQTEIEEATEGFCGTFALALFRVLRREGVQVNLIAFLTAGLSAKLPYQKFGDIPWRHFAVEVGEHAFYDIRGRVSDKDVHEAYDTDRIMVCDEESVVRWTRDYDKAFAMQMAYSNRRLRDWKRRLDQCPVVFEEAA
jgi:hypothetical protein